ncbi:hypothetical protein B0T26DRAFT_774421 [Lasiosphaeria miniovina]|uniref:DUF7791 domain-containing protein n=1 Tax=Lasiosphaeria miniovina TaxID=1954250 RepID=A0AA40AJC3_9PEZI|nr:uncharacterized protein B0T26DRAFT_774421 [Lasiosphaeria miniovina]KAK0716879.1 hypothetical protein B0T26DRAFT_774421 [Lasiosphaeria miniovina]
MAQPMDPVSALSLAKAAVQFVQFAASLLDESETKTVYSSPTTTSRRGQRLEAIHQRLTLLCSQLRAYSPFQSSTRQHSLRRSRPQAYTYPPTQQADQTLVEIAVRFDEDCCQLLVVVQDIEQKVRRRLGTKCVWPSFRIAMSEIMTEEEIQQMQQHFESYRKLMILKLCTVSREVVDCTEAGAEVLSFEMRSQHNQRSKDLDQVSLAIYAARVRINDITADETKTSLTADEIYSSTTQVSQLSAIVKELAMEQELLRSLNPNCKQRPESLEEIAPSPKPVFGRLFKDKEAKTELATGKRLETWLARGKGIFWISGHPGAGKSTLVKFIAGHKRTKALLSRWAGSQPIVATSHHPRSVANTKPPPEEPQMLPGDQQTSEEGPQAQGSRNDLLRSILHDILCQNSDLIRAACAGRRKRMEEGTPTNAIQDSKASAETSVAALAKTEAAAWSLPELQSMIRRIASQTRLPFKICLFVDGLDEYGGDTAQLCKQLGELSRCPDIKLVVSSQPGGHIEDMLGKNPDTKLLVDELTRNDIRAFAKRYVTEDINWDWFMLHNGREPAMTFVNDICSRSRGVFLWVLIVMNLVRVEIANNDKLSVSELRQMVNEIPVIPENLGASIRTILESSKPSCQSKLAGTMLIALAASGQPLPVTVYSFHEVGYQRPGYVFKEETKPWSQDELKDFNLSFTQQLKSRCSRFLQLRLHKVEFLHPTVRDFFLSADMTGFLVKKAPAAFDSSLAIATAYAALIKHKRFHGGKYPVQDGSGPLLPPEHMHYALDEMFKHVRAERADSSARIHEVLDEVELSLNTHFPPQPQDEAKPEQGSPSRASAVFRQRILRGNLAGYVTAKLGADSAYLDNQLTPPLAVVLGLERSVPVPDENWAAKAPLLRELLRRDHDPNQQYTWTGGGRGACTLWQDIMSETLEQLMAENLKEPAATPNFAAQMIEAGIVSLLVDYNADVNAQLTPGGLRGPPVWAGLILACMESRESATVLVGCKDAYIRAAEKMLARARFDDQADLWLMNEPTPAILPPLRNAEVKVTARQAVLGLISARLRHLAKKGALRPPSDQRFELLAKIIEVFVKHAAASIAGTGTAGTKKTSSRVSAAVVDELQSTIRAVFPRDMAESLTGLVRRRFPESANPNTTNNNIRNGVERDPADPAGAGETEDDDGPQRKRLRAVADWVALERTRVNQLRRGEM